MFCGKCGAQMADGARNCPNCRTQAPSTKNASPTGLPARPAVKFAGFWLRLLAMIADLLIISVVAAPALYRPLVNNLGPDATPDQILNFYKSGTPQVFALFGLFQLIYWLYYASFESSRWQATPGKKLFGLFVTDLEGKRISFSRASGRTFAKIVSQFFFSGYIVQIFTAKRQALHDLMAGCLVLKKTQAP